MYVSGHDVCFVPTIWEVSKDTMDRVSSGGHSRALDTLVPPDRERKTDLIKVNKKKKEQISCFTTVSSGSSAHLHMVSNTHCACRPAPQSSLHHHDSLYRTQHTYNSLLQRCCHVQTLSMKRTQWDISFDCVRSWRQSGRTKKKEQFCFSSFSVGRINAFCL